MAKKEEDEAPKPKKSKLKIIILLIIVLLLIGGGVGVFWWFQLRTPADATPPSAPTVEQSSEQTEQINQAEKNAIRNVDDSEEGSENVSTSPQTVINLVKIPTVTVNLADKEPIRYLKLGMDIELTTDEAAKKIESQLAKVRDAIIITLSSKTYAELATTTGKLNIKNEISTRLNQIIGAPRVVQIYFTEFVIQ